MVPYANEIHGLDDLFVHGLRDIFYTENVISRVLPRMARRAADGDLKQAFETHILETSHQIDRLTQVFELCGAQVRTVDCPAFDGIVRETDDITADIVDKDVLDEALIAAARAMEHYQISRYGSLAAWAARLGRTDGAILLRRSLEEEEMANDRLTMLVERKTT